MWWLEWMWCEVDEFWSVLGWTTHSDALDITWCAEACTQVKLQHTVCTGFVNAACAVTGEWVCLSVVRRAEGPHNFTKSGPAREINSRFITHWNWSQKTLSHSNSLISVSLSLYPSGAEIGHSVSEKKVFHLPLITGSAGLHTFI